jgi:siroheme synthase-like protein
LSTSPPDNRALPTDSNRLFPVFLKLETLSVLLIGGGNIGYEKLDAILSNAPDTIVRLVALEISDRVKELASLHRNITLVQKAYDVSDLNGAAILVVAVNDIPLCEQIRKDAGEKGLLANVADKPSLCDFYLGSIVSKGHLKIAISTNGKSPTVAKRLKEMLNETIPAEMDDVLNNMQQIREQIDGSFSDKVRQLNDLTKVLVAKQASPEEINLQQPKRRKRRQIVKWCLLAFVFMVIGHAVFSLIPWKEILNSLSGLFGSAKH